MPFPRPSLTALIEATQADIATALPGADALLRFSNLGVLAYVMSAMVNGLYGYLDYIALNGVPFTATGEYLEAWAALKGITRLAATPATGQVRFAAGAADSIQPGTGVVRATDSAQFTTSALATAAGGAITVTVTAVVPGAAGNTTIGALMTLGTAIAGITSSGVATTAFTGGADLETDPALTTRMLQAYAAPAQGGDLADYVTWALTVPGVTRVWNAGNILGPGTVQIYFMMDAAESAFGGFPQGTNGVAANEIRAAAATGDQLLVANAIYPLRPVTALVYAYAPLNNPVAFTISGISTSSAITRAAIAVAMAAIFTATAAPGGVTDVQGNPTGQVDLSDIDGAIAAVAGTHGFVITSVACPHGAIVPGLVGNITSSPGYLATLGVNTYV